MAQRSFEAAVTAWVTQTKERMEAVFRLSAQYVIEDIRARTPRDTGYLVNSLTVTLDGPLPMRGKAGDGYVAPPMAAVIAGAGLGSTITASFVAEYSGHVEYGAHGREGRGMVRLAAQNWQQHVDRATAEAKARVAGNARN